MVGGSMAATELDSMDIAGMTGAAAASAISNSGEEVMTSEVSRDGAEHCIVYTDSDILIVYEVPRCVQWILDNSVQRVALQFPQEAAADAPLVLLAIAEAVSDDANVDVFIIFNSHAAKCCVSQKEAEYGRADGVIQFGRSCLTPTSAQRVLRVFAPRWIVDPSAVAAAITTNIPEITEIINAQLERNGRRRIGDGAEIDGSAAKEDDESLVDNKNQHNIHDVPLKEVVMLYDTRCAYAMSEIEKRLRKQLDDFQVSKLIIREVLLEHETNATSATTVQSLATEENDKDALLDSTSSTATLRAHAVDATGSVDTRCVCSKDYSLGMCQVCLADEHNWKFTTLKDHVGSVHVHDDSGIVDSTVSGDSKSSNNSVFLFNGRLIRSAKTNNPSDFLFVYVGRTGPTLTSMSLKWSRCKFYVVDPKSGTVCDTNAAKIVMQRNFKIEQIRDANKIGILIGNFALPHFHEVVKRLWSLIKKSGKKPFVQFTAHPDLAKLINVPNIDVFIYIACPESTIIERSVDPDLYKLMATPWELELALNLDREWSLSFETNCVELLSGGFSYVPLPTGEFQDEKVSVSLLTNKLQSVGVCDSVATVAPLDGKTGAVATKATQALQKVLDGHAKGLLWGDTQWYGLDPNIEASTPIGIVVEGRTGIAGGYDTEETPQKERIN